VGIPHLKNSLLMASKNGSKDTYGKKKAEKRGCLGERKER
jgi:hypothetical protein